MASATNLECPKDMRCNPPPPSEAKCPPMPEGRTWVNVTGKAPGVCAVLPDGCTDRSCLGPETPCPLPMGQMLPPKFTQTFTIIQRDAGCLSIDTMECPPNVACNPPPPTKVTCPPGITPQSNVTIGMLPDGTCAVAPAGCAGADCAGAKVDCPPP